jgi:hypothetical protein
MLIRIWMDATARTPIARQVESKPAKNTFVELSKHGTIKKSGLRPSQAKDYLKNLGCHLLYSQEK